MLTVSVEIEMGMTDQREGGASEGDGALDVGADDGPGLRPLEARGGGCGRGRRRGRRVVHLVERTVLAEAVGELAEALALGPAVASGSAIRSRGSSGLARTDLAAADLGSLPDMAARLHPRGLTEAIQHFFQPPSLRRRRPRRMCYAAAAHRALRSCDDDDDDESRPDKIRAGRK